MWDTFMYVWECGRYILKEKMRESRKIGLGRDFFEAETETEFQTKWTDKKG